MLALVDNGEPALGTTKHAPHPAASILFGLLAWLMAAGGMAIADAGRTTRLAGVSPAARPDP